MHLDQNPWHSPLNFTALTRDLREEFMRKGPELPEWR